MTRDASTSAPLDPREGRWAFVRRWPRASSYPLAGVLLAAGSPAGLLLLRAACGTRSFAEGWLAWTRTEISAQALTYTYLLFATALVFGVLGRVLGRKEDQLEASATTDGLTGIANRRQFTQRLGIEMSRAARERAPVSVLLVDVDHLKVINDEGGHSEGDRALRAVGESLAETCREIDLPARIGGDEFAIIAPSAAGAQAARLAERVRDALRARAPSVTVSIGIASARGGAAEALMREADDALYAAKAGGRDRVVLAGASGPVRSPPSGVYTTDRIISDALERAGYRRTP